MNVHLAIFSVILGSFAPLQAATTAYSANFDSAPLGSALPTPFVESGSTNTANSNQNSSIEQITPGDNVLTQRVTGHTTGTTSFGSDASASIPFTDLGGSSNRNFTVSTSFRIDEYQMTGPGLSFSTISMSILGSDAYLGTGNRYTLTYTLASAVFNGSSSLSIRENASDAGGMTAVMGEGSGTRVQALGTNNLTVDTIYAMTMTGTYTSGVLRLTGTLSGGNGTTLLAIADDTTPQNGTNFGVYSDISSSVISPAFANGVLEVDFETFSVIPEPSSVMLIGVGVCIAGLQRRRA